MPELPEVETTRRGIFPHICGNVITSVDIRNPNLRWPIPENLRALVTGLQIHDVTRRGKYLLLHTDKGKIIIHLGMSGSLRIVPIATPPGLHDHIDLIFNTGWMLRLCDPRRFGSILWQDKNTPTHKLLTQLGPEPLSSDFSGRYLHEKSRGRSIAVKNFIMDSHIVVGVGNIYACESLHLARIHPVRSAGKISLKRYTTLAESIKLILNRAIEAGGTTLRDFTRSDGEPGYFQQSLAVYGREGKQCLSCHKQVRMIRLGQRSTFFCCGCQK